MKRFHIHLAVEDLEKNIEFYSTMFACQPTVKHDDYAKWMLDEPCVNFAISNRSEKLGVDHLGIQVDEGQKLAEIKQRLDTTQQTVETQEAVGCCYSQSDKHWIMDPQGIAWEAFHSLKEIPTFNEKQTSSERDTQFTCGPVETKASSCCG